MKALFLILAPMILLSACGESAQAVTEDRYFPDVHASTGAKNAYVLPGWKPGDKTSWENQIRTRGQHQNEYLRTN